MGVFKNRAEGGLMDVIRCDEDDYLVWKWRPNGGANSTNKENAIRWGSSLRVKEGEAALFVYRQEDGAAQEFIEGPYDDIIKTANFPVLTNLIGLAYAGKSPFQAEIYFINLASNIQVRFGIPYFDVFDPRFSDFGVPVAVRGSVTFGITDYRSFGQLYRVRDFDLTAFSAQIKDALTRQIKAVVTNTPKETGLPVFQLEQSIDTLHGSIVPRVRTALESDFGVSLKRLDIAALELDKESEQYRKLVQVTRDQEAKTVFARTEVGVKDMRDTQEANAVHMRESQRIQREEMQRAQKLETEGSNLSTHQFNLQADVAKTAADSLGKMGNKGGGAGFDPGSMMASMAMGGAVASGMANTVGNMMNGVNQGSATPPPPPQSTYRVVVQGHESGPHDIARLKELAASGDISPQSYVWRPGLREWKYAEELPELHHIFEEATRSTPPPPPPTDDANG